MTKKKLGKLIKYKERTKIRKTSPKRLKNIVIKELKRVFLLG